MLKNIIYLILFLVLILSSVNFSFAQSEEEIIATDSIYLWVPEKMIQNETYEGLIVLDEATNQGKLALISSSDSDVVEVEPSIFVNSYKNHGIFKITPKDEGNAEIFVSVNGELSSTQVQVYSQKSGAQSLSLYLPANNTKTDEMSAYVFTLDRNNSPVPVKENTVVKITSTNGVSTEPEVMIKQDEFYTKFLARTKGDGTLSVSSKNLNSDVIKIGKIQDDIDVKLAIAPNIVATDSFAYYYVWLEKNGSPFNIPAVIDVILHSSDPKVVRLTSIPPKYQNDNIINISLKDGIGKGIVYTGKTGHATITASIAKFGSASTDVFVGVATMGEQDILNDEDMALQEFEAAHDRNDFDPDKPNSALLWVYPSMTSEKAWGVAALYFSNSTETINISLDDEGSQISSIVEQTTLYPITTDGRSVTVSSNGGLEHDSVYEMSEHGLKTHAIEFEIVGNSNGKYVVELSGTGIEKTSATVEIKTSDKDEYHANITPLPAQTNLPQELAIISVVDSNDALVNVKEIFGKTLTVGVSATSARLNDDEIVIGDGNTGVVTGILTGTSILSVTSNELGLREKMIYPTGISTSLELLVPKSVHVGEKFPFVIHEMDSQGVPLEKTFAGFSSSLGIQSIDNSYFILETQGKEKISTLSDIGADQKEIESFSNPMDVSVSADRSLVRVGEDITLQIFNTVSDATYAISSPFPYEQISNELFKLTPNSEMTDAEIIISSSKDGYISKTNIITVTSEYIVTVNVDSIGTDGNKLNVLYDIEGMSNPTDQTPKSYELKPQQITIIFPQKHSMSNSGYEFQNVLVNGQIKNENIITVYTNENYDIIANYQRQIQITVNDGNGGGIYPYGTSIVVSAPEKQKLSFLIRDVFDHWIGVEDEKNNSFVMTVTNDKVISAVYREDYSYLMMTTFIGISALSVMILKKRNDGYAYKIKNIVNDIFNKFKKSLDVKKIKIPKKKKEKQN